MLVLPALPFVVVFGAPFGVVDGMVEEDDGIVEVDEELDELGVDVSAGGVLEELLMDELDDPDGVTLVSLELGVEVVELLDEELGVLGVTSVVDEVVEDVEGVAVELLLRSQPVTAAVATASTATRGMSLFMTSPFRTVVMSDDPSRGRVCAAVNINAIRTTRANAVLSETAPRAPNPAEKLAAANGILSSDAARRCRPIPTRSGRVAIFVQEYPSSPRRCV